MEDIEEHEVAVGVRGACKRYNKKTPMVLDRLDMIVDKGTIYGLLGPSGCGKTTLLGSIVGCKKIQGGMISVFGNSPGTSNARSIGYMPQETALVGEFTVKGALEHFGWIFGMTTEQINEKHAFLEKLLDLPPAHKLVKHLSGGQQRRLSLAVVLVHDPQLLILDEPTVGLDPVLRQNMWDYFLKLTEEQKKTIIITTHYIEEARQAHTVGLMRHGKILAEGKPQSLLNHFDCSTLEDLFLLLSTKQKEGNLNAYVERRTFNDRNNVTPLEFLETKNPKKTLWQRIRFIDKGHAKALMSKNLLRYKRHPGTLIFAFIFPIIIPILFFTVIGSIPNDIKIGVVNEEMGNYTNCEEYSKVNPVGGYPGDDKIIKTCEFYGLGCRFLDHLGDKLKNQIYFKTKEEALNEARKGNIHHILHFPSNYSEAVTLVRDDPGGLADHEFKSGEISVYHDVFDYTLSIYVEKEIIFTYFRYVEGLAIDCKTNIHAEKIPLQLNDPIYGTHELTYTDFMAPGILLAGIVGLSLALSALTIITERAEGIWERTIVTGVTTTEILIFHIISISLLAIVQLLEVFAIAFGVFHIESQGVVLAFCLAFLQSLNGIVLGILISIITNNITDAGIIASGLFYPFLVMSGTFWPLEGMPDFLRYFSYFLPITISVESLSNILHRGWGISNYHVYKGFFSASAFILFFMFANILILKYGNK